MTTENPMTVNISAKVNANFDPAIEATSKGLNKLGYALFGKRDADVTRYRALVAAQTHQDVSNILSGNAAFRDGVLVSVQSKSREENHTPLDFERAQEAKNLSGNVQMAIEALKDVPNDQVSDKEMDDDFFARWRREAKVIGNEDLQRLWGRLLAKEIKDPDTISYRALDILKNVTSTEANLFQKIAPYVSNFGVFVCNHRSLPESISLSDLATLRDAGLIGTLDSNLVSYSTVRGFLNGKEHCVCLFKGYVFVSMDGETRFNTPGFGLTSTGKIALNICDFEPPTLDQIKYLCQAITHSQNSTINNITVYKINSDNSFSFSPIYSYPEAS